MSIRTRLTLWNAGLSAATLSVFAVLTYAILTTGMTAQLDASLTETAQAFASAFKHEIAEHKVLGVVSGEDAVRQGMREFSIRDRQVFVYDADRRLIAVSPTSSASSQAQDPTLAAVEDVLAEATRTGQAHATLSRSDGERVRAVALRSRFGSGDYLIVATVRLGEHERFLASLRRVAALTLGAMLAAAGFLGYFVAGKSLSPVAAMTGRAERIGAANLHERLPVADARDELGQLATVFNRLLERLQQSFEQQRQFMADASHELRTPVAVVRGEAEVALSKPERAPEEYREALTVMRTEGRRMTAIVEDLFLLARADAGQHRIVAVDFDLGELIDESVRALRSLAARKGLTLRFEPAEEAKFTGDEHLSRRMLVNLLTNAVKYTKTGGVTVTLTRRPEEYVIAVSDTGRGIAPETREKIFERFYRTEPGVSLSDDASGAGLGLPIARWIAEAHGGRLVLAASGAEGSTFEVRLPRHSRFSSGESRPKS